MESNNPTPPKLDVYQIVTDQIISLLEKGTIPWQKPWNDAGIPMNLLSKRPYRGINLWLLNSLGYERNLFLTWDQLKKLGGSVKKGETGHIVIYWKTLKKEEKGDTDEKKPPILRYYKVFNALAQCTDLPKDLFPAKSEHVLTLSQECELIIDAMPESPLITFKGRQAYYDIGKDTVVLPQLKSFKSTEGYYSTLFHELVHSTGHEKRLNRPTITQMVEIGGDMYSLEELVAEMGAAYLSSIAGNLPKTVEQSAAYIKAWVSKLKNDKKFIVQASGYAQKAADFILNIQSQTSDTKDDVEQSEMLEED